MVNVVTLVALSALLVLVMASLGQADDSAEVQVICYALGTGGKCDRHCFMSPCKCAHKDDGRFKCKIDWKIDHPLCIIMMVIQ